MTYNIGDTVTIKRNLKHPAWTYGNEPGTPPPAEIIGQGRITQISTSRRNRGTQLVLVSSGFWYEQDGTQEGSGATLIELHTQPRLLRNTEAPAA